MLSDAQREEIIREAETWYGTPYVGHSCTKGAGVDCGQLIKAVYTACGHCTGVEIPESYSLQIAQHRHDTMYVDLVEKYMREIPESEVKPGDVVMYKIGHGYTHGGIIKQWPHHVIHAIGRRVTAGHGLNNKFGRLDKKFFTLRDDAIDKEISNGNTCTT